MVRLAFCFCLVREQNSQVLSMSDIKIGFAGAGRMAQAIGEGLAGKTGFLAAPARFFDPADKAAELFAKGHPGTVRVESLQKLCDDCNVLILAVKPQVMPRVIAGLARHVASSHVVISIAAGTTLAELSALRGTSRLVRVMPNTPCLIGEGISALAFTESTSEEDKRIARAIFQSVGETIDVPETQLDGVTGLSGCGPAWVFTFVESLIDGGVLAGLPRDVAQQLALQTIRGSIALIAATGKSPAELRGEVTSPGGTTIAGLAALERAGFRGAVMDAVSTAARRARELGR